MVAEKDTGRRPLDRNTKRNLFIIFGVLGVAILVVTTVVVMTLNGRSKETARTSVGQLTPQGTGEVRAELSPAMRKMQNDVFEREAEAARRDGTSYIPREGTLGRAVPIEEESSPSRAQESTRRQRELTGRNRSEGASYNSDGLKKQVERIAAAMKVQAAPILIFEHENNEQRASDARVPEANTLTKTVNAGSLRGRAKGADLSAGMDIMPAITASPIDTDKSQEATAKITGGPFEGAYLIGKLAVHEEDFEMRFNRMKFNGRYYQVEAVALNETTASTAMGADVDHHVFSRYFLPILTAPLAGVSTYFDARGRTATQYLPSSVGGEIVVSNDKASKEEAVQQGVGEAIDKGVQTVDRFVQGQANKPNRMTLPQFTSIGVRFEKPVYESDGM